MRKTLPYALLAAFCAILCTAPLEGGGVMLILKGTDGIYYKLTVNNGVISAVPEN